MIEPGRGLLLGDIVQLKINGPEMVVISVAKYRTRDGDMDDDSEVICQWFSKGHKLQTGHFFTKTLVLLK